jgi:hypothetical protein
MDDRRFDRFTLRLGTRFSRRTCLQLAPGVAALIGLRTLLPSDDAAAKVNNKKKKSHALP